MVPTPQLLLEKGYTVFGTYRRTSSVNFWRLDELGITQHPQLKLVEYDLTDLSSTIRLLEKAEPQEVYNLAAQSFVGVSFEQPITTADITGIGALNLPRRFAPLTLRSVFTRLRRQRCSVRFRRFRSRRARPFTRAAPTGWPSCLRTGQPLTIASHMAFLAHRVFCSITNPHCAASSL